MKKKLSTMAQFDALMKQMWGVYWGIRPYRDRAATRRTKWIVPIIYTALALLLLPFTAHATAGLVTQIGAQVRTAAGLTTYSDQLDQDVPIVLPTTRYTCIRRAPITRESRVIVLISCMEGTREGFVVGTGCDLGAPDESQSVVTVNISKDAKPVNATFTVACRTFATAPGTSL